MASPDVTHGVLVAVGLNGTTVPGSGLVGEPNAAIVGLTTPVTEADGIILGDLESGDDGTGITLPQFVRQSQALPDVEGSFTKRKSLFVKGTAEGLTISFQLKGNGLTPIASAADEAIPLPGINAIYESAGLLGAPDAAPQYDYQMNPGTKYLTIRLWSAGQSWIFNDCLVETLTFPMTGGESTVVTAAIRVGAVPDANHDERPVPASISYGTMESLTPPLSENMVFTWGAERGFGNFSIEIANTIEDIPDSNQDAGIRLSQSERFVNVSGEIWMNDTNTDFEWQTLIDSEAAASATGLLGSPAADPINGINFILKNIDVTTLNYTKAGAFTQAVIEGNCSSDTSLGNDEFTLTFD